MPKRLIRFNLKQNEGKKQLFLKDPKADFMVILQKKIFPLHAQFLAPSQYFQQLIAQNKKSVAISSYVNADYFEKILGCFYGIQAAFERHNIVDHILGIMALLRVKQFDQQLKADMRVNFDQYGLFSLFYLSRKLGLNDIQDQCIQLLIDEQFQQINYNKYDLFQLSPELFSFVLKQHQRLKAKRSITGLDKNQIRGVCQQYSKTNSAKVNIQQIFQYGKKYLKQSLSGSQDQQKPVTRKRNATWNNNKDKQKQQSKNSNQFEFQSQPKLKSFEQKTGQVIKIKQINSNMQEHNNRLAEQIRSVKSQINNRAGNQQYSGAVEDLTKKLKQFQERSMNAHKKMEELKDKILRISTEQPELTNGSHADMYEQQKAKITMSNSGPQTLTSNKSGVLQNTSKVLSEMAVLQKSQNLDSEDSDY